MDTGEKFLVAGGIGIIAWMLWRRHSATSQITAVAGSGPPQNFYLPSQAAVDPSLVTSTAVQLAPPSLPQVAATQAAAGVVNNSQLSAMLAWAKETGNPDLYTMFVNQLDAVDMNGMYDILINEWDVPGMPRTPARTAFWNDIRARYPFLSTGGVNCTNFQCK